MGVMTAGQAVRLIVASDLVNYRTTRSPSLKNKARRLVLEISREKGWSDAEIAGKMASEHGYYISPAEVAHIRGTGDERGSVEDPQLKNTSGTSHDLVIERLYELWAGSETYPSFEDLAAQVSRDLRIRIPPKTAFEAIARRVNRKLKNLGGRSTVDLVGWYAMQGMGRNQILAELEAHGLTDVVPPRRIVELWDYYKRLHPEETANLILGDDRTYAVQRDQAAYGDRIRELSGRGMKADEIASELGITEVEVWSHLIGAKSDKVHMTMRSKHDQDLAAVDAAGRLPTQWVGEGGPSPSDISRFEGVQNSGPRRIERLRRIQMGQPTVSPPSVRGRGDYEWALGQLPQLREMGYSGQSLQDELNARNPEGWNPWTRHHMQSLRRRESPAETVAAFAPSDRFIRLSQFSSNAPTGQLGQPGMANSSAQQMQQQMQQQEAQQKEQLRRNLQMLQTLRQQEQMLTQQLAQLKQNRQKLEQTTVQMQQGTKVT